MSRAAKIRLARTGVLTTIVAALEYGPRAGLGDTITLVPLSEIAKRLWEMLKTGALTDHLVATGGAFFLSFLLSAITGVPLGWLLWRYKAVKRVLDPYLTTYYAIPIFAFYPLLLAILGFNLMPIVAISWAWSVVAVALSTAIGFGEIREVLSKVGRGLNLNRWQITSRIYFPAAVPYIFTGLKFGMVYSLIGVIASEFVLSTKGLGFLVSFSYVNFQPLEMYASMYLVLAIALVLNLTLNRIERRLYARVG